MTSHKFLLSILLVLGTIHTTHGMDLGSLLTADEHNDAQGFYMLVCTRANCEALKESFLASPYAKYINTKLTTLPSLHTEDRDQKLLNFFFEHLADRYCGKCLFGPEPKEIAPLLKCFLASSFAQKVNLNVPTVGTYLIAEAAKHEDKELVTLLSDAGASTNVRSVEERNKTALQTAREHGVDQNLPSKKQK